jgi:glycerol-3-phosphate dehydrogenase
MRRQTLESLAEREFDVLVVGGGILGACVAWDAALRGLDAALIERGDFGSGASANSLKTIHGGLRYLQDLDFRRMRQSIHERSVWLRIAPHLVEPLPFLIPAGRGAGHGLGVLRAALAVNDLLSWDRNRDLLPERGLPSGRALSKQECRRLVPAAAIGGSGGVLFYDAQMYSSERLVLAAIQAARAAGAVVANYVECEAALRARGGVHGVRARDMRSGEPLEIHARFIVNAAGAGVPAVARRITGRPGAVPLAYTVALNFVLADPAPPVAFALKSRSRSAHAGMLRERRQLFVVPWRGQTMVGTGHYRFDGDPGAFQLTDEPVEEFLAEVNAAWPERGLRREDVRLIHAGLLPAAPAAEAAGLRLLKRHRIYDHAADGVAGLLSAASVKYTTARRVAEEVVTRVFRKRGESPPPCRTAVTPLPGGEIASLEGLLASARERYASRLGAEVVEHLVRSYGTLYERVLAGTLSRSAADRRVVPAAPVIEAQFVYGVREEMAAEPTDLVFRRTELGARGLADAASLARAAELLRGDGATPPATTAMPGR